MKKIISFILTVAVCLSVLALLPVSAATAGESVVPVYYGVQRQTSETDTTKQNLRFVSLVNSLDGDAVGYEITAKYGNNESKTYTYEQTKTDVVFSSILAGGKTYTAEKLGAEALMTVVITNIPTNIGVIEFIVTPCVKKDGNLIRGESSLVTLNGDKIEGTEGEVLQVSVMTFNVLNVWDDGSYKSEGLSASDRSNATSQMICDYGLDFVCFQEFDILYRQKANFVDAFKNKYAELDLVGKTAGTTTDPDTGDTVTVTIDEQSRIWNPIYYDKTQYTVVGSGVYDFLYNGLNSVEYEYVHSDADNNTSDSRSLVWGVFRHITTGELFIVANTHFSAGDGETVAALRKNEADFVAGKIDALYAEYGCTTIVCGDYNSHIDMRGCATMTTNWGYYDTCPWDIDEGNNGYHNECKNRTGYSTSSMPTSTYQMALDHILSKTELDVVSYDVIGDVVNEKTFTGYTYVSNVLDLSDHCPVIMTFNVVTETSATGELDLVLGDAEDVTTSWVEE